MHLRRDEAEWTRMAVNAQVTTIPPAFPTRGSRGQTLLLVSCTWHSVYFNAGPPALFGRLFTHLPIC